MIKEEAFQISPRVQAAIDELASLISARFPDATFLVRERFDPPGISLVATVDIEDIDEVVDVIGDRMLEMQVEEGLPVYVVPLRPIARSIAELREHHERLFPPLPRAG